MSSRNSKETKAAFRVELILVRSSIGAEQLKNTHHILGGNAVLAGLAVYFESRRSPPSMPFQSVAPVGTLPRKGSMARSSAVLGTGILLIALVVLVFSGTAGTGGSLAEKGHSEKHAAAAAKVAPKQKALTASQRAHDISEIKSLKAKIRQEQGKASKLDETVREDLGSVKKVLLKAKKVEKEAMKAKEKGIERTHKAAEMVKQSKKMAEESKDAKKKFLAEEAPMESASKLLSRDHSAYRKAELQVAHAVTELSEKSSDAKLQKQVRKLVQNAQGDRKSMEKDHRLLTKLERKIASLQLDKSTSYSSMMDESVALKKKAGVVAETVEALKEESHHLHQEADADVAKVKTAMRTPDRLHREAMADRAEYAKQASKVQKLEAQLAAKAPAQSTGKTGKSSTAKVAHTAATHDDKHTASTAAAPAKAHMDQARKEFLAGLFSAPWNKAGGDSHGHA